MIALLVVALIGSLCVNMLQLSSAVLFNTPTVSLSELDAPTKFSEVLLSGSKGKADTRILQLNVSGVITSAEVQSPFAPAGFSLSTLRRALEQAVNDDRIKAIVLNVNTPGGEVTASDNLYHEIKKVAAKKPVVVYMDSMATSGGYYISAGASKIVANPTTLTGSIGVIIQTLNYSEAFGKVGLQAMTFVSGSFKDSLNGARPMRDEEKAYIQNLVGQMYDRFVGVISEGRKIPQETLKSGVADGRILSGQEALDHKLIDQIGYLEDAYAVAKQLAEAPDAAVVQYRQYKGFFEMFSGMAESQAQAKEIKVQLPAMSSLSLNPGQLYLLPAHLVP